jgi:hypothetical protein
MGKGNKESDSASDMMAQSFKDMSGLNKEMQAEAAPWRKAAGSAYMDALNSPEKFAAPGINEINRGTAASLNSVEQMQPGGTRDRAGRDLRMNQMSQKATMLNQTKGGAAAALGNLGIGGAQTGISAMGQANTASSNLGQMGTAKSQAKAQGMQGMGSMLGGL